MRQPSHILALLLLVPSQQAQSSSWELTPQVGFDNAYINNLNLDSSAEQNDLVTQVNPEFSLKIGSPRINANVDYRLQNLFYHSNSEFDKSFHQLNSDATFNLIPNTFRVRSVATYDQQVISFDSPTGSSNLTGSDNTTDRALLGIEPVWTTQITRNLGAEISNGYYFSSDQIDSDSINYSVNLFPLRNKSPLNWRVSILQRYTDYDNGQQRDVSRATTFLSLPITGLLSTTSEIGYEANQTDDGFTTDKENGSFFSVGLRWLPKGELELNLNFEDHYYGDFISTDIHYKKNRLAFALTYDQEVTTDRDEDIRNITGTPGNPTSPTQTSSTDSFLQKTIATTTTYSYERGKIVFLARFDDRETENQLSFTARPQEELVEYRIDWHHLLTRRSTLTFGIFQRSREVTGGRDDKDLVVSAALEYKINATISGNFYLNNNQRDSNDSSEEYRSTTIGLALNVFF